jgi:anti-anti-sigma factor
MVGSQADGPANDTRTSRTIAVGNRRPGRNSMKIEVRKKGKICILDLSGKITFGPATEMLDERFMALLDSGERFFVFNMTGVPWLDSGGIGHVVQCHKRVRDRNGVIKLVLKGKSHDLFTMYELHKVFEIFEDLEEALASFADLG